MNKNGNIIFVCTGNAGRSPIAQYVFKKELPEYIVESAGVNAWAKPHETAVKIMSERGIDLSKHIPKQVENFIKNKFDIVVTIGEPARKLIPHELVSNSNWIHWDIKDPAEADGTADSENAFQNTYNEIINRMPVLISKIKKMFPLAESTLKPGVSTGLWYRKLFEPFKDMEMIAKAGFKAIELSLYFGENNFPYKDTKKLEKLRSHADSLGINIWSVHAPSKKAIGSIFLQDSILLDKQLEDIRKTVAAAEVLGSKTVVTHALCRGDVDNIDKYECTLNNSLQKLCKYVEDSPVSLAFENDAVILEGRDAFKTLEHIKEFPRDCFGYALDTGHANTTGELWDLLPKIKDRIITLHINDNLADGKDSHDIPGKGNIDWDGFDKYLVNSGYRGCYLYEVVESEKEVSMEQLYSIMKRELNRHMSRKER